MVCLATICLAMLGHASIVAADPVRATPPPSVTNSVLPGATTAPNDSQTGVGSSSAIERDPSQIGTGAGSQLRADRTLRWIVICLLALCVTAGVGAVIRLVILPGRQRSNGNTHRIHP
jgi:hypothetical protein